MQYLFRIISLLIITLLLNVTSAYCAEKMNIGIEQEVNNTSINFPWQSAVKPAIFFKGEKLWIVFDKYAEVQFPKIPNKLKSKLDATATTTYWIYDIKQEKIDDDVLVISIDLAFTTDVTPFINVERDKLNWQISITSEVVKKHQDRDNILFPKSKPNATPSATVELNMREAKGAKGKFNIIEFDDPYTGSKVSVIPTDQRNTYVPFDIYFVDFILKETSQGVAIEWISDDLAIKAENGKININKTFGLNIAPKIFQRGKKFLQNKDVKPLTANKSYQEFTKAEPLFQPKIFDKLGNYITVERNLRSNIIKAKSIKTTIDSILDLGMFFLSKGFYKEAFVMYQRIEQAVEQSEKKNFIKLFGTAAAFMDRQYDEAFNIADTIDIANIAVPIRKEFRLWKGIASYKANISQFVNIGNDPSQLFKQSGQNFLRNYTNDILFRIALTIIDSSLEILDNTNAYAVISYLSKRDLRGHDLNLLHYYNAKYYGYARNYSMAIKSFSMCSQDYEDHLNRTQCRFERTKYQYANNKLLPSQFIGELEKLSTLWRGDQLEIRILKKLGRLYYKSEQYLDALRTWNTIATYYPNSQVALNLLKEMSITFMKYFFSLKTEDTNEAFAALALFYEFQNLIPIGTLGDEIVIKFASLLVQMDLLDRASVLLTHQVESRLNGTRKEEIINLLADIHIMNDKPNLALNILNLGDTYAELPENLEQERRYIHARALANVGDRPEALLLLKDIFTQPADDIKADIYWSYRKWYKFNNASEPYLYSIRENDYILTQQEARRLLRQMVSYISTDDYNLLDDIYQVFKNRIPEGKYKDIVSIIMFTDNLEPDKNNLNKIKDLNSLIKEIS